MVDRKIDTGKEHLCFYVCSRGLLKSCTFHSPNPQSSFPHDTEYLRAMLPRMFPGMSIYVCSDVLSYFVDHILPRIGCSFTLVSGDSDLCVPREALNPLQTQKLLKSPFLRTWFAQNTQMDLTHKIVSLPIGLDYHTISNNPQHSWRMQDEGYLPFHQERILVDLIQNALPLEEREIKIYVNLGMHNDRFGERKRALSELSSSLLVRESQTLPRTLTWTRMTQFAFVLSPFGNGMDCHRTWEALCLGCIPIVKDSIMNRNLFSSLNVLIVNNWKDITLDLLQETVARFSTKIQKESRVLPSQSNDSPLSSLSSLSPLQLKYWVDQIRKK